MVERISYKSNQAAPGQSCNTRAKKRTGGNDNDDDTVIKQRKPLGNVALCRQIGDVIYINPTPGARMNVRQLVEHYSRQPSLGTGYRLVNSKGDDKWYLQRIDGIYNKIDRITGGKKAPLLKFHSKERQDEFRVGYTNSSKGKRLGGKKIKLVFPSDHDSGKMMSDVLRAELLNEEILDATSSLGGVGIKTFTEQNFVDIPQKMQEILGLALGIRNISILKTENPPVKQLLPLIFPSKLHTAIKDVA